MPRNAYQRPIATKLLGRLAEVPRLIQIMAGPRQVGKTTLIEQLLAGRPAPSCSMVAADPQALSSTAAVAGVGSQGMAYLPPTPEWLQWQWGLAVERAQAWLQSRDNLSGAPFVFVVDEVQNVPQWSSLVKGLWDEARRQGTPMHLVLLGSAPLLMQQGLTESLAGRFELIRMGQWSFAEMHEAFGFTLDQYIHFGGYPGSGPFVNDEERWRDYVRAAIVEPSIEKDVLAMTRVDRPALLRQLFELGCAYSGQILSLDKASGQLGRGHTQTLAENLTRLSQAGLLTGLHKYAGQVVRQRASPPKFQVHDNGLMTATSSYGFEEARADRSHWGRQIESTVGAHLVNTADADTKLFYWRERDKEVDFVVEHRGRLAAIEVKATPTGHVHAGLEEFRKRYPEALTWVVGAPALPLGEFVRHAAAHWVR